MGEVLKEEQKFGDIFSGNKIAVENTPSNKFHIEETNGLLEKQKQLTIWKTANSVCLWERKRGIAFRFCEEITDFPDSGQNIHLSPWLIWVHVLGNGCIKV